MKVITPVYEELNKDELLHRCLGGFSQNNNESLNSFIWSFALKCVFIGTKTIKIATYIAISIFNEDYLIEFDHWIECGCNMRET